MIIGIWVILNFKHPKRKLKKIRNTIFVILGVKLPDYK
jgi:hypothetical protein